MKDKLQAIIEDAQDDNYSDSPRFVDAILKLLAPELEKARKWDALNRLECVTCPCEYHCFEEPGEGCFVNMIKVALKDFVEEDGDE